MTKEEFEQLEKRQQAVLLAKDVIVQVKAENYRPINGYYILVDPATHPNVCSPSTELAQTELCELLPELDCHVCAKGALFLSHIRVADNFKVADLNLTTYGSSNVGEGIIGPRLTCFSLWQLEWIEAAYEGWGTSSHTREQMAQTEHGFNRLVQREISNALMRWEETFPDKTERLIKIMENIVANDGEFNPFNI
jgi:hypothetical protein